MESPKHKNTIVLIDLLFNILLGFVFLFMVAFLQMHPPKKTKDFDPAAKFMIIMTWPDGSRHDVDLWVLTPDHERVGFRHKQAGVVFLYRDDRGAKNDTIHTAQGDVVNPTNREIVSVRAFQAGTYVVNVHLYKASRNSPLPVPVKVQLVRIKPYYNVPETVDLELMEQEEKTAFQFTVTEDKKIVNINTIQHYFIFTNK